MAALVWHWLATILTYTVILVIFILICIFVLLMLVMDDGRKVLQPWYRSSS